MPSGCAPRPLIATALLALALIGSGCSGPIDVPEEAAPRPIPSETPTRDPDVLPTEALAQRLQEADQALQERRFDAAIEGYQRILAAFAVSTPAVENIRNSLMEAEFLSRDYDAALETSQEILDGNPSAATIKKVLGRRYEIGLSFLAGAKRRVLGLSVSAEGRGLEILDELVEKYPFQDFADDAVYHIASWYLRRDDYPEAERLFQRLLRDYPTSPWSTAAEYRIGEAALRRLKGVEYDFGTLETAERRFRRYLKLNPAGDQSARARESLAEIDRLRAERWLKIAEFYIGFDKEDAARVYLRKLRENHPQTDEGLRAEELLEQIGSGSDATP